MFWLSTRGTKKTFCYKRFSKSYEFLNVFVIFLGLIPSNRYATQTIINNHMVSSQKIAQFDGLFRMILNLTYFGAILQFRLPGWRHSGPILSKHTYLNFFIFFTIHVQNYLENFPNMIIFAVIEYFCWEKHFSVKKSRWKILTFDTSTTCWGKQVIFSGNLISHLKAHSILFPISYQSSKRTKK